MCSIAPHHFTISSICIRLCFPSLICTKHNTYDFTSWTSLQCITLVLDLKACLFFPWFPFYISLPCYSTSLNMTGLLLYFFLFSYHLWWLIDLDAGCGCSSAPYPIQLEWQICLLLIFYAGSSGCGLNSTPDHFWRVCCFPCQWQPTVGVKSSTVLKFDHSFWWSGVWDATCKKWNTIWHSDSCHHSLFRFQCKFVIKNRKFKAHIKCLFSFRENCNYFLIIWLICDFIPTKYYLNLLTRSDTHFKCGSYLTLM